MNNPFQARQEAQDIAIAEKLKQQLVQMKKAEPEVTAGIDALQNLAGRGKELI